MTHAIRIFGKFTGHTAVTKLAWHEPRNDESSLGANFGNDDVSSVTNHKQTYLFFLPYERSTV